MCCPLDEKNSLSSFESGVRSFTFKKANELPVCSISGSLVPLPDFIPLAPSSYGRTTVSVSSDEEAEEQKLVNDPHQAGAQCSNDVEVVAHPRDRLRRVRSWQIPNFPSDIWPSNLPWWRCPGGNYYYYNRADGGVDTIRFTNGICFTDNTGSSVCSSFFISSSFVFFFITTTCGYAHAWASATRRPTVGHPLCWDNDKYGLARGVP